MITQVKTPRDIFYLPQRLLVPLFQRPYVWSKEAQWQPLWEDVTRLADRSLDGDIEVRHFLGAVVLQQQLTSVGNLSSYTIIDGQQRLTTLQLLLDAIHDSVVERELDGLGHQLEDLVRNQKHHCRTDEDRFKVWPTNRDREGFAAVMGARMSDYTDVPDADARMVQAHAYFKEACDAWLAGGGSASVSLQDRARALVDAVSVRLQVVVIDLQPDEDAQEIFETLNARGTPLTAADLIKNFVFQRLDLPAEEQEKVYREYWEQFETPFWEKEVSAGRIRHSRSSLFLTQWLAAQTRRDITTREVFSQFKRHVDEMNQPVAQMLQDIRALADLYESLTVTSLDKTADLNEVELFLYRVNTMQVEVVKPLLLWMIDPQQTPIPADQMTKALRSLESWLVRRSLMRTTNRNYNRLLIDLLQKVTRNPRETTGDTIETFLAEQSSISSYWPTDQDLRRELKTAPIYKRLSRSRLRMILEAIEDHRRGFDKERPKHEARIKRDTCTIEHVMPQRWALNWPLPDGDTTQARDEAIHTLGNLTLVTSSLNSDLSNRPWTGPGGKREILNAYTSILLTREVVTTTRDKTETQYRDTWNETTIRNRTDEMINEILTIWPVPEGHTGSVLVSEEEAHARVTVADLIADGLLEPGQTLYARTRAHEGRTCQVNAAGHLYVDGQIRTTPTGAAKVITGSQSEPGWWFWLTTENSDTSLSDLRRDYLDSQGLETDDEDDN
jgi:hypothetical protein